MLVITRRVGEILVLELGDERVEITVRQVHGNSTRIGIDANDSVRVIRKEILEEDPET